MQKDMRKVVIIIAFVILILVLIPIFVIMVADKDIGRYIMPIIMVVCVVLLVKSCKK